MFKRGEKIIITGGPHKNSTGEVLFYEDCNIYKIKLGSGHIVSAEADNMKLIGRF